MAARRIPSVSELPGGFRVVTRHVTHARLQELNADSDEVDSLWHWDEENGGTIYLQTGRDHFLRIKDYIHEMRHAQVEWCTWFERRFGGIG